MRTASIVMAFWLASTAAAWAQQTDRTIEELRTQLAMLKVQMGRIEATLERLEAARVVPAPPAAPDPPAAPALNTPPRLPPSEPARFAKAAPRFDVLMQTRFESFGDGPRANTFRLRKAELGIKGHVAPNADFSIELDPVRPADPFRRTYLRLTPHNRLHVKLGLEKAPLGLEELTTSSAIPFVDRSEVNDRFAPAEELGVHVESRWTRWLFQAAVTNGNRRQIRDDDANKAVTGRVVWAPESWLSLGAAAVRSTVAAADRRDRYNVELKAGSNLSGGQFEGYRADDAGVWSTAYYAAAYWAIPTRQRWITHVQPVVRYESIHRSDGRGPDELGLVTSGVSLLFDEHRSKLQVNYLWDVRTRGSKNEFRTQYQVEF